MRTPPCSTPSGWPSACAPRSSACTSSTWSRSRAPSCTTSPARSASSRTSTSRPRCVRRCAMHAAAEVASGLSLPLTVIHVGREDAADGTRVLDEARRYLHSYGLALSCETITGYPHQRIVEFIRERGHDLLFIGAYGHSR